MMQTGIGVGLGLPFVDAAAGESSSTPTLDNAVAYWRASDYSGSGDWLDGSGNGHDATAVGGVSFSTDKWVFDGVDDHFTVADHDDFTWGPSQDYTIVAVIKRDGTQANGTRIIGKEGQTAYWYLEMVYGGGDGLRYIQRDGSSNEMNPLGTDNALATDWVNVAARVDRTAETAEVLIDGVVDGTDADTSNVSGTSDTTSLIRIGAAVGALYFDGEMKGVAIFRSALSDADIVSAGEELEA